MDLTKLRIPHNFTDMITTTDEYYRLFYFQLVRMSNTKLTEFVNSYLDIVRKLSKSLSKSDKMRAVIGCLSLHRFGYRDFTDLSTTFDRTIPQTEPEYVAFTSYAAGELTLHPSQEQSRYVQHLLERSLGWIRGSGRRARPLAAAQMIKSLAVNAGNNIVSFLPQFQTSVWLLLKQRSIAVLEATASLIKNLTISVIRYARADLEDYLSFYTQICLRLLSYGSYIRMYAALIIIEQFVTLQPGFYLKLIISLYTTIIDVTAHAPPHLRSAAYVTISCFAEINPKLFIDTIAPDLFEITPDLLRLYPSDIVRALIMLMKSIPEWMKEKIPELIQFVIDLLETNAFPHSLSVPSSLPHSPPNPNMKELSPRIFEDSALNLLGQIVTIFGKDAFPLNNDLLTKMAALKMSEAYIFCFTSLSKIEGAVPIDLFKKSVINKIQIELKGKNADLALKFISDLPPTLFEGNSGSPKVLDWIQSTYVSGDVKTRCETTAAIFQVLKICKPEDYKKILLESLNIAVFDESQKVRCSVLRVIKDHCNKELGEPENIKFLEIYANDEDQEVRKIAFQILAKLADFNPLYVSAITRSSLVDYFFTIRHVNSIRQRANIIETLPDLIQAASVAIKTYSSGLIEIIMEILSKHRCNISYTNFLEKEAENTILIRVIYSLSLLAPLDVELVSLYADELFLLVCDFLINTENRKLALAILDLFQVLYTAPASCLAYRQKAPMIFSVCSKYLAKTNSRKIRMAILMVVGLIGVMEVHQQPMPKTLAAPENIDPDLARQFFNPSRDSDDQFDDVYLLQNQEMNDTYYSSFCARALLEVFNDESLKEYYHDAIDALVEVLRRPRMSILNLFDCFCSRILTVMEGIESNSELVYYIQMFTKLISTSTNNTAPFLARTMQLINRRFCKELQNEFLDMIIAFLTSVRDAFSPFASDTVCLLISCLDDSMMSDIEASKKVLKAFSIVGLYADDLLYLIVPKICDTILCDQTLTEVKIMSFISLSTIARSSDLFPSLSILVRAISYGIHRFNDQSMKNAAMQLVYILLKVYGKMFLTSANPLFILIKRKKLETLELRRLINEVNQGKYGDSFKPLENEISEDEEVVDNDEKEEKPYVFSADVIVARVVTLNLGASHLVDTWLHSFIGTLIISSPSSIIRACSPMSNLHYPFALKLFKPAFFSCFKIMKKRNRLQIINTFRQLLNSTDCSENVVREIIDLIVFMDKVEMPLSIPNDDVIRASIRYGHLAYALRLQQKMFEKEMDNELLINHLIDIFVQLSDWPNAIGVWKKSKLSNRSDVNRIEIMAKLHMWDKVESFYRNRFEEYNDFDALQLLAESLASTAKWESLFNLYKDITSKSASLGPQDTVQAAQYFAEASMHLGQWEVLDEILKSAPDDNERVLIISAINEIHKGNFDQSNDIIERGFSLLASSPITLWSDNQQINQKTMLIAQEFMEITELNRWMKSNSSEERTRIEETWKERMKTVPHNFDIWFALLANRIAITNIIKDDIINLFQMKSITLGTKIHNNAFDVMFPHFNFNDAPDYHKICYIVSRYSIGDKQEAIKMMGDLAKRTTGPLNTQCHYFYATWLIENDESIECQRLAYKHLKQVVIEKNHQRSASEKQRKRVRRFSNPSVDSSTTSISGNTNFKSSHRTYSISEKGGLRLSTQVIRSLTTDISNVDSLRKWAEVNNSLAQAEKSDPSQITKYVTNAIDALTQCAEISPSFPDVVQLLNLFFEHANHPDVFNSTAHACIERLHPKLLLQASPQLLIQLSHNTPAVATFVHDILFNLLCNHYHDLIFSIIVMKFSKNYRRARAADGLLKEFHEIMPQEYEEVELIRRALLKAAVTWSEKILQRIQDAHDHFHRNKIDEMVATLHSILILTSKPRCEMEYQFLEQYSDMLTSLNRIISSYNSKDSVRQLSDAHESSDSSESEGSNKRSDASDDDDECNQGNCIQQMASWCRKMNESLCEDLKSIHVIQLSSISPQLCQKTHFSLAVAGTYRPGKPIVRIKYFVGQYNVYMTKQQPKDVVVMGEDGNYYQYLLKGHEDLRLDERIMQFFRLINSFLKKETGFQSNLIEAMTVIPLSMSHGLVQWIRGTDTLRNVVQQYRTIHNKDPLQEYVMLDKLSTKSFDLLLPIQKVQVIEKVFQEVPDNDLADFFWLKAESAEMWLKQTNTFSITTGMTSIVCYIIGLGDRHPSNLLIDKITGKVIHIDFGDCFERAANRPFLPEVVPFRLTRMMVRALGPAGVDGLFKSSFINMSNVLRDNKRVLVMVLAIFVHEPLIDPETFDEQETVQTPPVQAYHKPLPLPLPPSDAKNNAKKKFKKKNGDIVDSMEEDENDYEIGQKKFLSTAATGSVIDKGRVYMVDDTNAQSSVEMRNRVRQKLNGNDFGDDVSLSVEDQATRLIHDATSIYNISKMYSGWCPFW